MVLFISLKNIVHNNPYYHATIVGRGPQNTDLYAHYQKASFVVDSLHNLSEHNVVINAQNAVQTEKNVAKMSHKVTENAIKLIFF